MNAARGARFGGVDGFADACVRLAARRWPPDLVDAMAEEWRAELAAVRADTSLPKPVRLWRALAFAIGLVRFGSVGSEESTWDSWRSRAARFGPAVAGLAGAVGVVALSGALFGALHDAYHRLERVATGATGAALEAALVLLAVAMMAATGLTTARRWSRQPAGAYAGIRAATVLGFVMFLFLWIGNRVAVMPFMGWRDVGPAVAAWTVSMAMTLTAVRRLGRSGRRGAASVVGAFGVIGSADVAAAVGSLHAAATLGVATVSAPAWFPLALLPAGIADLGRSVKPVAASASHAGAQASAVLLGNASAMVGPLLLCAVFAVAYTVAADGVHAPARRPAPVVVDRRHVGAFATWAACGLASIATWAVLASSGRHDDAGSALRVTAIAVAVAAFVALRASAAASVAGIGAFATLVALDRAVDGTQRQGLAVAVALVAVAGLVGYVAWLAADRLGAVGARADVKSTDASPRRVGSPGVRSQVWLAVAIVAALATPGVSPAVPSDRAETATYVLTGLAWLTAVAAALASRESALRSVVAITLIAVPLAGALAALRLGGTLLYLPAPLAVAALAAARWDGRWRHAYRWLVLGVSATALGVPLALARDGSGDAVGMADRIVNNSAVFGFGFVATAAGQIALAVALGIVAMRLQRGGLLRDTPHPPRLAAA